jgi:amidophosphoribosyltransferase
MGVDMATYKELIAHKMDVESIRQKIGADSLAYLSLEGLLSAVKETMPQPEKARHCTACFSGKYPINIPEWLFQDDREKLIFEEVWGS